MAQIDDLKAAVAAVQQSITDEIARVEAVIAALSQPNPDIAQAITDLTNSKNQLDAERPAAPPPPPAG